MKVEIGQGEFHVGDCFDVMATLPDGSVDMILTDVPYNEVNRKSGGLRALDKGVADDAPFSIAELSAAMSRVCSGSVYVFCGFKQISDISIQLENAGFSIRVGVWHKTNPSPMNGQRMWLSGLEFCVFGRKSKAIFNEHCKPALWTCPSQPSKIHATQKPVKLFERLVEASSDANGIVLDCFAGSGTTAIAAENSGRKWICVERDEEYAEKAMARIRDHVSGGGQMVKAIARKTRASLIRPMHDTGQISLF